MTNKWHDCDLISTALWQSGHKNITVEYKATYDEPSFDGERITVFTRDGDNADWKPHSYHEYPSEALGAVFKLLQEMVA